MVCLHADSTCNFVDFNCYLSLWYVIDREYSLLDMISTVNRSLESMGMKINYGRLEVDGSEWYGLVNTVRDAAAKKASAHLSQAQFEYLKQTVSCRCICVHDSV